MDLGIVWFSGTSVSPARLAQAVEERGFESLFYPEHTHIPPPQLTLQVPALKSQSPVQPRPLQVPVTSAPPRTVYVQPPAAHENAHCAPPLHVKSHGAESQ